MVNARSLLALSVLVCASRAGAGGTSATFPYGSGRPATVALLPVVASGVGADEAEAIDGKLAKVVERKLGALAISARDVNVRLEAGGVKGVRCERIDPTCSAQIGAVVEAEVALVASFSTSGKETTLAFRVIDVALASQVAHAMGPVKPDPSVGEIEALLSALARDEARASRLVVHGKEGAVIVIDGAGRGVLPLAEIGDLPFGTHTISVGLDGEAPLVSHIELRPGEIAIVDARAEVQVVEQTLLSPVVAIGGAMTFVAAAAIGAGAWAIIEAQRGVAERDRLAAELSENPELQNDGAKQEDLKNAYFRVQLGNPGIGATVTGIVLAVAGLTTAIVGLSMPSSMPSE